MVRRGSDFSTTRTVLISGGEVDSRGLSLSFLLHAGVLALVILGPPQLGRELGPVAPPVPIEVIDFDTFTQLANNDPTEEVADEPQLAVVEPDPEPEPPAPVEEAPPAPAPTPAPPPPAAVVEPVAEPPPPPPIAEPAPEPTPEPAPAEPVPEPVEQTAVQPPAPVPVAKPTPPPPRPEPQQQAQEQPTQEDSRQAFLQSVLRNLDDTEPAPRSDEAIADQLQRNRAEATASSISVVTRGTADRLTASQADALRRHIGQFWNIDAGARGISEMVAVVQITLNAQREVVEVRLVEDVGRFRSDGFYRSFAERALRAVQQASPLTPLPLEGFQTWQVTTITFSPRDMFQ